MKLTEKEILLSRLEEAIREKVEGKEVGVLLSGGLDSTVIASIARDHSAVTAYTVGIEGSHDLLASEDTSHTLGINWIPIILTEKEIISSIMGMQGIEKITDPLIVSFQLPVYIVALHAREKLLMNGQGADELFGGYARYEHMDMNSLEKAMEEDLDRVMSSGSILDKKLAAYFDKDMIHPYLDPRVVCYVRTLPFDQRIYGGERKALLRDVARNLGIGEAAERPKKAAQYGSGIMRSMKAMAKSRGSSLRELMIDLSKENKEP